MPATIHPSTLPPDEPPPDSRPEPNARRATEPCLQTSQRQAPPPRFLTGSIMRHILVMTGTSAIGLMAIFIGELISILFLGLLRDLEILAATGYAASVLFFPTSIGIGISIATTSIVAPAVGSGDMPRARRLSTNAALFALIFGLVVVCALWPFLGTILTWMGATGRTHALAQDYLRIMIPALPLTVLGMCCMSIMRSLGDAERSMNVPLFGAAVQFALEPFMIFMLKLGMNGAATAMLMSRVVFAGMGLYGAFIVHRMYQRPNPRTALVDFWPLAAVAVPAVLTNIATPIANIYTTSVVSSFGDAAVAAWAIAGRVTPVAFGIVFSLSGAVGPIIGQNYGARDYGRVRASFNAALKANFMLCTIATVALITLSPAIINIFGVSERAGDLVRFYCLWCAPLFFFLGLLFVANAAFNVLGHPHYATLLNWARATLGTMPLVWFGGQWAGAEGVFFASAAGGVLFGFVGVWLAYRIMPDATPAS
jgi:putative MATE family efflux protein